MEKQLKLTKKEADLLCVIMPIVSERYDSFVKLPKGKKEIILREKFISETRLILNNIVNKLFAID